jgi:hypothetical protein
MAVTPGAQVCRIGAVSSGLLVNILSEPAVSARLRDARGRLDETMPEADAHLDRSIRTGLHCSDAPVGDDAEIRWNVEP